jgi:TolA-binding protein
MRKFAMTTMTAMMVAGMVAGFGLVPVAAQAQSAIEGRVGRLESEMRAVQRKVFPGGRDQYVQPDITAPQQNQEIPGSPSGSPVADLDARVSSLESQITSLTGQIETNQHKIRQIEDAFNTYKRTIDARLRVLEENASSTGGGLTPGAGPVTALATTAPVTATPRPPVTTPAKPTTPPPATGAKDPVRAQKLAAVEKPVSDDPAEDAYLYGYRLWQGQFYPEAEVQLKKVVTTYPKHKRASYAQNLLGRSYLDEGKPSLASIAFYDNYKKMPDGERAPDSLYYLAQALMKLGKPADACKVYGELSDVYEAKISATMKADIARGRTEAKCK